MILSEEGKYYFDEEKKEEYTKDFHDQIIKKFFPCPPQQSNNSFVHIINETKFTFSKELAYIKVKSSLNKNEVKLLLTPIELEIEITEKQKIEIIVFSEKQFDIIIKYHNIDFPIVNSFILTKEIKESFFKNKSLKLEVINLPLKKMFSEKIDNNSKDKLIFGNLSKYIKLYMKNEIHFGDFPEKNYFNEKNFSIKNDDKMDYYYTIYDQRFHLWLEFGTIIDGNKSFFFTGPHGIGKTFSLLGFLAFYNESKFHYIYINLDILNKEEDFMKILFYEARNLFSNVEEYISAFKYLEKNLKYPFFDSLDELGKDILLPVFYLMEYIISIKKNILEKYVIVIDQFKYIDDGEYISKLIKKIKEIIENNTGFSLIVCSSINYHGIKQNLIKQIEDPFTEQIFPFKLRNQTCKMPENNNENLSLLGYLPRYRRISNLINLKYINFMKKLIKQKFFKFYQENTKEFLYDNLEDEIIKKLKWIKIKKMKQLPSKEMKCFIEDNPIKYFLVDLNKSNFDYLFPLLNEIINEIIQSYNLKHIPIGILNDAEKGWYFEHLLFDCIKNKNIFINIYIEKSIMIKTIFKKEKIKNFDNKINILFYFSYSNVKRYDAVIYNGEKEEAILIQASRHKHKKKLSEYTNKNLENDISKIENKFFKVNKIKPKKYYLIFVLDYDNYYSDSDKMEELSAYDYNYIFFQTKDESFHYEQDKPLKEIIYKHYELNEINDEEIKGFIFTKNNYFKKINENDIEYKPGYYYVEKGMTLLNFLEETCDEYENLIDEISQKQISKYELKTFNRYYYTIMHIDELKNQSKERIVLALNDDHMFIGKPIKTKNIFDVEYEWQEWAYKSFSNFTNKILNESERKKVEQYEGFFIFEKVNFS